jgi:Rad3-related DNA helicase
MVEFRDYQEEIIKRAVEALQNGRNVVVNAPTGTGKTLMALETLRRLDKKGYVYVRTISQYSSWERDAKKLGLSFAGLMRKGEFCKVLKKPYMLYCTYCGKEVGEDHVQFHKKFIERRYINPYCYDPNPYIPNKWYRYCPYRVERIVYELGGDAPGFVEKVMSKMYDLLDTEGLKTTANWFRDNKIRYQGEDYDVCVYKLVEGNAKINIYSYVYFFLGIKRPKTDDDNTIVIFDEAHNLDDFNTNSVTLTLKEVEGFFERIVDKNTEKLKEQAKDSFIAFVQDPDRGFDLLGLISKANPELAKKFSIVMTAWDERDRWYIERDNTSWTYIKVMPADPSTWLSKLNDYKFILLSGTLPSADYLRTVWGLRKFEYINALSLWSSTSLKNHFSGLRIFVDDSVYYIRDERRSQRKKVVKIIKEYSTKDGLNLVILPSYDELEVYKTMFPNAFFEDPRPDVLDRVKGLPNGSLVFAVAGGKLSEGIEVLDSEGRSRVRNVFIVGLPIPEYKDPYLEKMIEVVSKRVGKDQEAFKWVVLYEKAVIKVKQAIGRAIRSSHDVATIYLIDKRYTYRNVMEKMGLEVL